MLRPGGAVHFLEHGLSPDPGVAKWQHRIEPLQRRLADGCHLTRDSSALVEGAGFVMQRNEQRYVRGPKPWSWFTIGACDEARGVKPGPLRRHVGTTTGDQGVLAAQAWRGRDAAGSPRWLACPGIRPPMNSGPGTSRLP